MKKYICLTLLSVLTLSSIAQNKFGHINAQEVLMLMPEYKKMENTIKMSTTLKQNTLKAIEAEFEEKYLAYQKDVANYDESTKIDKETELQNMQKRLQDYNQNATKELQEEEFKLLEPIEKRIMSAIDEVAKDGGYTYIFNSAVFYYGDNKNDVLPLVKKKLGI